MLFLNKFNDFPVMLFSSPDKIISIFLQISPQSTPSIHRYVLSMMHQKTPFLVIARNVLLHDCHCERSDVSRDPSGDGEAILTSGAGCQVSLNCNSNFKIASLRQRIYPTTDPYPTPLPMTTPEKNRNHTSERKIL